MEVLSADVVINPHDSALYESVATFGGIGVNVTANVFFRTVVDLVVTARNAWLDAMSKVASIYDQMRLTKQAEAVRTAVKRLEPEHCFTYLVNADIPPDGDVKSLPPPAAITTAPCFRVVNGRACPRWGCP